MEVAEPKNELLPAVLSAVLAALPPRFAPSRGFASVCVELAVALAGAWLAATASAADHAVDPADIQLQERLGSLVGRDCAVAWWADAAEELAAPLPGGAPGRDLGGGSGAGGAAVRVALAAFMLLRREGPPTTGAMGHLATAVAAGSQAWARFGAAWVACALADVVGSVAAHCARKTASLVATRPTTPGGSRPLTPGGPPRPASGSSGTRPASSSGGGSRPGTPGAPAVRPGTSGGLGPSGQQSRQGPGQPRARIRLLALKHFVAAAKGDEGLQACPVLEACLAEVATGAVPHAEVADLMASAPYRERVLRWAEQEANGGGPPAVERALSQALKAAVAPLAPRALGAASPRPSVGAPARAAAMQQAGPPPTAPEAGGHGPSPSGRGSWLPQAFIREFNAEGDEVEPEAVEPEPPEQEAVDSEVPEAVSLEPEAAPGPGAVAANASGPAASALGPPAPMRRGHPATASSSGGGRRAAGGAALAAVSRRRVGRELLT